MITESRTRRKMAMMQGPATLSLVDPELTYSLPAALTATTGLDALTQVIEPFVSRRANPYTDGLCREGMGRIARSLGRAFRDADPAAREDMALASLFSGLALANAGLGAVHGIAGFERSVTVTRSWHVDGRTLAEAAGFGIVNPFLYYVVLFEAYDRLPAQIAQPLNYTWAIALALLAVPVLGQRLSRRTLAGISVSYAGVVVVLTRGEFAAVPQVDWLGVGCALASTLLWAGYWLLNARSDSSPTNLMALSFATALPVVAVACAFGPGLPAIDRHSIGYGAWVGLVEMGVTFLLWQRAMRLTRHAARIGQLIFLSPFISLALIAVVLGEPIHATSIVGLAVIVAGIMLTERARAMKPSAGA